LGKIDKTNDHKIGPREEKIKTMVDDIMEKLPDPFNMAEIMGKVEERTPYVIVAFQVDSLLCIFLVLVKPRISSTIVT
jgi:hypothetical protein